MKQSISRDIYNQIKNWSTLKPENVQAKILEYLQTVKPQSYRTPSQNNSIHLYLSQLANELDRQGHTMQDVVKVITKIEVRPTMQGLKEVLWKPVQKSITGKESTTELSKQEDIDLIYDSINKWTGHYFEINVPFPCDEQKQLEKLSYHEDTQVDYPVDESLTLEGIGF